MPTSTELRTQRAALIAQAREITSRAEAEKRELSGEEQGGFDQRMDDADKLKAQIETAERRERVDRDEAEMRQVQERKTRPDAGRSAGDVTAADRKAAVRAWALAGTDHARTDADTQVRAASCGVNMASASLNVRALSKGTAGAGGYTVPTDLSTEIEKSLKFYSPIRGFARVVGTETGADLDWPKVSDTANAASIVGEAGAIATNVDPTFSKATIKAWKYATPTVLVSVELLQDTAIDIEALLADLLTERMARGQNAHFVNGTATTQPEGLATSAAVAVNLASGNAMTTDKLIDLIYSVDRAYRANGSFVMHDETVAAVVKLKDSTGQYLWQPGLQAGEPDRFKNYPVVVANEMTAFSSPGDNAPLVLFGDLKRYVIRDVKSATQITRLNELYAATGQVGFVLLQRTDGRYIGHTGCVKALNSYDTP